MDDDPILVEESFGSYLPNGCCSFCSAHISVPYYKSKEEDYGTKKLYLHKVCSDLPEEIEHKLHPGHTLQMCDVRSKDAELCNVCNRYDKADFSYRCSDCSDFVLDLVCALKSFPITHDCHPQHPLIPIHEENEKFLCAACTKVGYGISYKCMTCPFRVHQNCVSPRIIKLPFHRHDLKLIYSIPQNRSGWSISCQVCREDMKEQSLAYHCARCRYFVHIYNCRPMVHSSHDHPLFFVEEEEASADFASGLCHGCGLKISVPYYACNVSYCERFFLHKSCAELPQNVESHLHPEHSLTLSKVGKYVFGETEHMCNACHTPWKGFRYYCVHDSCRFNIDIVCAMKTLHSKHEFHQHSLISSHTKASFPCHACNIDSDGATYQCTTCRFWVHQQCASALVSKQYDLHPHKLKLTYSLSESHQSRKHFRCHACREEIPPHSWAYHCAGCKYFTHVHTCIDPFREIEGFDYEGALAAAVHLPVVNESISLATLFFMDTIQEADNKLEQVPKDGRGIKTMQMPFIDPKTINKRSSQLVRAPCNNCDLCKCLLQKSPEEVQDPSLLLDYYSYGTIGKNCHRFSIIRNKEKLDLHISSAVLPCYVKHEGHSHVLSTTYITESTWCNACENDFEGYCFRCNICKFTIDMYCAMLPGSISHKYDKEHGFKLTYYSVEDVEEYVCEICEEDITTMWFYHCADCDHSIHSRCIWKNYIKFNPFEIPYF